MENEFFVKTEKKFNINKFSNDRAKLIRSNPNDKCRLSDVIYFSDREKRIQERKKREKETLERAIKK